MTPTIEPLDVLPHRLAAMLHGCIRGARLTPSTKPRPTAHPQPPDGSRTWDVQAVPTLA